MWLHFAGISEETWNSLKQQPATKTALDILQEHSSNNIITCCKALDDILGGGIPTKLITEFTGPSGSGKTQICLQLCISVQLPEHFGGISGHAVYVDTNYGFCKTRLQEMAVGTIRQCHLVAKKYNYKVELSLQNFMDNIRYVRLKTFVEILALVQLLRQVLEEDNKIKLIVIDSITEPMKHCHLVYYERTKILYTFLSELQELAQKFNFAIVLTNYVTTKFSNQGVGYISSSLGDTFAHRINNKIKLKRINDTEFVACSGKSILKRSECVNFRITNAGIRDLE